MCEYILEETISRFRDPRRHLEILEISLWHLRQDRVPYTYTLPELSRSPGSASLHALTLTQLSRWTQIKNRDKAVTLYICTIDGDVP